MDSIELEEKLNRFKCMRCNVCCRQAGYVYLDAHGADNIARFLEIDPYLFTEMYCDLQDRQRLVLKKNEDESCVFLTERGCSIYLARPQQCRDFPVKWRTPRSFEYCAGLWPLQ